MDIEKYFNKKEALSRIRGNEKLLVMMLKMFLTSKEVAELENCLDARDIKAAEVQSHAVKGLAGNLSLTLLYEAASNLNLEFKNEEYNEDSVAHYREVLKETQVVAKSVCGL